MSMLTSYSFTIFHPRFVLSQRSVDIYTTQALLSILLPFFSRDLSCLRFAATEQFAGKKFDEF